MPETERERLMRIHLCEDQLIIGVYLCTYCLGEMRRIRHPFGWIKYLCDNCHLVIPSGLMDARDNR